MKTIKRISMTELLELPRAEAEKILDNERRTASDEYEALLAEYKRTQAPWKEEGAA